MTEHGRFVKKSEYGNVGGISAYWRWYTELPSGIRLVEAGGAPCREPDKEKAWHPSAFQAGGIITKTWLLSKEELIASLETAARKSLVFVGRENLTAAIKELQEIGFRSFSNEWADKGYLVVSK